MRKFLFFLFMLSFVITVCYGSLDKPKNFVGQIYGHQKDSTYCYALFFKHDITIIVYGLIMKNSSVEEITTLLANEQKVKPILIHKGKETFGKISFESDNMFWVYYITKNKGNRYFVITIIYKSLEAQKANEKNIEEWVLKQKWVSL